MLRRFRFKELRYNETTNGIRLFIITIIQYDLYIFYVFMLT